MRLTKNFTEAEVGCKCGCGKLPTKGFMQRLQALRDRVGKPLVVTSGARCAKYNRQIGGAEGSMHIRGRAVDLSLTTGPKRYEVIKAAFELGFTGVGFAKTFIHLDDRGEGRTPTTWFY